MPEDSRKKTHKDTKIKFLFCDFGVFLRLFFFYDVI